MRLAGRKPKSMFSRNELVVSTVEASSQDYFAIYATNQVTHGQFIGSLKVATKTDNRLHFPFVGAPTIAPFTHNEEALRAAEAMGFRSMKPTWPIPKDNALWLTFIGNITVPRL